MLKNLKHYSFNSIILSFLSLLSITILTKNLDIYNFGLIALSILIGNIISSLLSLGIPQATVRYYYESLNQNPESISLDGFKRLNFINLFFIFIIHFIFLIFLIYLLDDLVIFLNLPGVDSKLILFAFFLGFVTKFYDYFTNLMIAEREAKRYSFVTLSFSILLIITTFLFLYFHGGTYISRIYSLIFCYLIFILLLMIKSRKNFTINFEIKYLIKSLKYSYPSVPEILLGLIGENFDKTFLAKIKSVGTLGIYDVSLRFSSFLKNSIDVIIKVWTPEFMILAEKNDKEKIRSIYFCVTFYMSTLCLFISYFAEEILILFTSKSFYVAKYYIPLISFSILINHLFSFLSRSQNSFTKKLSKNLPGTIVYLLINVACNIYAINLFGIYGACLTLIFSGIISSILNFYLSNKKFYLNIKISNILIKILNVLLFLLPLYIIYFLKINFMFGIFIKVILLFLFIFIFFKKEYLEKTIVNSFKSKFKI